ncbi:chymotrypsin-like elastase family member 2A [Hemitrygon akajei]|uniref:chymotrypsin-like elastase family member 2A n=1 Tax=Hemitrygon akajei TaxID=2704970 RepID=UPI003BF9C62C
MDGGTGCTGVTEDAEESPKGQLLEVAHVDAATTTTGHPSTAHSARHQRNAMTLAAPLWHRQRDRGSREARTHLKTECSHRPAVNEEEEDLGTEILGDHDADPGAWPWLVSIQIVSKDGTYVHTCSGSVINNYWVLSAAHCFKAKVANNVEKIMLVFGLEQMSRFSKDSYARPVADVIKHENYNPDTESNDIALIKVTDPIVFTDYVQPVCLQNQRLDIAELKPCVTAGWGMMGGKDIIALKGKSSGNNDWMNKDSGANSVALVRIWGVDKLGICKLGKRCNHFPLLLQTDSGGPLVCKVLGAGKFYQLGVTSWGLGCGQKAHPGIYTSVRKYIGWIQWKTSKLGQMQEGEEHDLRMSSHTRNSATCSQTCGFFLAVGLVSLIV